RGPRRSSRRSADERRSPPPMTHDLQSMRARSPPHENIKAELIPNYNGDGQQLFPAACKKSEGQPRQRGGHVFLGFASAPEAGVAAALLPPQGNDSIVACLGGNMGSQSGPFAFFDCTYLINSAKQPRRLKHVSARLSRLNIEFERFEGLTPIANEGRADKPS